ncbi:MAG: sigma-70 family RNA polymerase sigma factor [Ignavibacteriae bacterium]|nr:sigma-70 family RNA polymerase sigma factor [Ignavibacteriota bacterium]MCB9215182.1 sigma-70 family RNA polymerase sigma factor [Ignavibacteria bacterium]
MAISRRDNNSLEERKRRFLELLEPVHDNLARFARSIARNDEDARDLVGETVLRALEHFNELNDEKAFLSWLFTIAVRLGRRWESRGKRFGEYNEAEIAQRPSESPSPEVRHDISVLYSALRELRDSEREAILLFEIAGLSLEEVQKVQGGSLSGVKSRLARGRKKLADLLGVVGKGREKGEETSKNRAMPNSIGTTTLIYSTLPKP